MHMQVHIYVNIHIYTYTYIYVRISVRMDANSRVYVYVHENIYVHVMIRTPNRTSKCIEATTCYRVTIAMSVHVVVVVEATTRVLGLPPSDAVIASLKVLRNFALDAFSASGLEDERVQEFDKAIVDNLQAAHSVVREMAPEKVSPRRARAWMWRVDGARRVVIKAKAHLDWIKASWESVDECVPGLDEVMNATVHETVSSIQSLQPRAGVSGAGICGLC